MIKEIKRELIKFLKAMSFEVTQLQPEQVKVSDKVVGAKVELIDSEGKLTAAPDGEYQVGEFEFTVKDGVISEIKGEAKPEESTEQMEGEEEKPSDEISAIDELKKETESIKAEIEEIKKMIIDLAGKSEVEEFKKEIVNLNKTLEAVAKSPAEFSKVDKNPINKEKQDNTASILAGIMKKK